MLYDEVTVGNYIIEEIYHNICPVTKNTVFSFNDRLYKQIDECGMGNSLTPVFFNMFMAKLDAHM